ncbi:M1 family metallopeptidase [Hazenella sp. IB182357]|uniref:M1 family metallopeptidase n=1 Tax=Polycladospora coralii TaxID=2771432 RepID=A0A926RT33_9BACL|nr:M1 family metallopeptidase [Polycladospora coralii]MBD1371188.1 M1 family metallopeptidase [Polycladospora coralii]MBS7530130.1 M1 family metallopeptidase [Polycladospora coralii]
MKRPLFSFSLSFVLIIMAISHLFQFDHEKSVIRPQYQIEARYNPDQQEVAGNMNVTLHNNEKNAMKEVYFRVYPNAFRDWKYGKEYKPNEPGFIDISDVEVNGQKVKSEINETVMRIQLNKPLQHGDKVAIKMKYQLHLPEGGTRLNTFKHTAFLAQWYPMLAVRDQDGWHTEPYTTTGDPFYTQMSDFEVTFHTPKGYRVISSGNDIDHSKQKITLKQSNIRDFAAVLTTDYKVKRAQSGKTKVNLWYLDGMEDVVPTLLESAVSAMKFYGEKFGEYPYEEIDVVLGETGYGIAGMEYPGLVTSVPTIKSAKGEVPAVNVVVHELAHQWWYAMVGNNQVKEPWLDEGITTFSEFFYMKEKMKQDEQDLLIRASKRSDEINDAVGITSVENVYRYPDAAYALMVYIRPAAMMFDLMDQVGEDKVMEILNRYFHTYQYKTATTKDFIQIANQTLGKDYTPFFEKWLYFKDQKESS